MQGRTVERAVGGSMDPKFDSFDSVAAVVFAFAGLAFFGLSFAQFRTSEGALHEITCVLLAIGGVLCWGFAWLAGMLGKR